MIGEVTGRRHSEIAVNRRFSESANQQIPIVYLLI
jgi:hypothetical protein